MTQSRRLHREPAGDFRLVPLGEFAEQAHLHHSTVRRLVKRGELPAPIRVGSRLLFLEQDLIAWLKVQRLKAAANCSGCVLELPRE